MIRTTVPRALVLAFAMVAIAGLALTACKGTQQVSSYTEHDLVADSTMQTARIDARLLNAWGMAALDDNKFAVAANHSGQILFYTGAGADAGSSVTVPAADGISMGAPSGIVRNASNDFKVPGTSETATLLIATEDGLIAAWSAGAMAVKAVDRSADDAVYKGIATAIDGMEPFIYAANFKQKRIDVFDRNYNPVTTKTFTDPNIPSNYGPFNIRNISGKLYVTYAIPKPPDFGDDTAGAGNGYVDIYEPSGEFVKRLVSNAELNSPWGIARATAEFGEFGSTILIGNFGDGHINAYGDDGKFIGALKQTNGDVVHVDGLWDMTFTGGIDPDRLFTTAGPSHESHGCFAYLQMK